MRIFRFLSFRKEENNKKGQRGRQGSSKPRPSSSPRPPRPRTETVGTRSSTSSGPAPAPRSGEKDQRRRPPKPRAAPPVPVTVRDVEARPRAAVSLPATDASPDRLTIRQREVDDALDALFQSECAAVAQPITASAREFDEASVREQFLAIAAHHAQPVKNFIFELRRGTATKEWIEICLPVMTMLIDGAGSMGLVDAAEKMAEFGEALRIASKAEGDKLEDAAQAIILESFEAMAAALPDSFSLQDDLRQRESIIIHSLLKQVRGVGHVTFDKLYGAGLTSLDVLFQARKEDIATTTGIPLELCAAMCDMLRQHREQLQDSHRANQRGRLRKLTDELRLQHAAYERALEHEWQDPAAATQKRISRENRRLGALKVEVLLAEMAEVEFVERLQKLSFERRIQSLEEFLSENEEILQHASIRRDGARISSGVDEKR